MITDLIRDKKILILGFGREGKSSYKYLTNNFKDLKIGIADYNDVSGSELLQDGDVVVHSGGDYLKKIDDYDLVLKSPGISLDEDFVATAKPLISSQVDLFLQEYHQQIVGVTGTKGKSTTATLVYHLLRDCGKKTLFAGNIGVPVFDIIDKIETDTIVVLELSCHQLQYVHKSPHISIFLNVFPEHLDYYKDFSTYKKAKLNISKFQKEGDFTIYPKELNGSFEGLGKFIPYGVNDKQQFVLDYKLEGLERVFRFDRSRIKLPGAHNLFNIGAACVALDIISDESCTEIVNSLYTFKGLKHRLEFVGSFNGLRFYNDSISTIPETTIAALRCFANRIDTLILGGYDRGVNCHKLAEEIKRSEINNIIFIPETGRIVYEELLLIGFHEIEDARSAKWIGCQGREIRCFFCDDYEKVVNYSYQYGSADGICLLSPAASSYNMFRDFEERGELFVSLVKKYGK